MTSVVTGASGHLGGNLVRQLLAVGEPVRVVVHRDTRAIEGLDVERVSASLGDPKSLAAAFDGARTVYHLAAKISIVGDKDGSVWKTNVDGARNAAQAALDSGVERYVHASSVHAFDLRHGSGPIHEQHKRSDAQNYAYDYSKAAGEDAVQEVIAAGLDACIVNPTGIIGPFDFKPSRMGQVFLDLQARKLPALVKGGFDFVDVRDVAASIMNAARDGRRGENYLLGGRRMEVSELAALASQLTGVKPPRFTLPRWAAYAGLPFAALSKEPAFTRESLGALAHGRPVDHSKAASELGHNPRAVKQSIRDIYEWFA